jgi:hypothetical protein
MRVAATAVALALATLVAAAASIADSPPRCASGSLRAWGGGGHPGIGPRTISWEYGFFNVGHQTCVIRGFPAVTMLDDSGRAMPTIVHRTGAPGYGPVQLIALRKGERVWFIVSYADETGYAYDFCPASARLRLTPPGDRHGVVLRGAQARIAPYGGTARHLRCGIVNVGPVHRYTPGSY